MSRTLEARGLDEGVERAMKIRVLVVEGDPQETPVLRRYLERLGYHVATVVPTGLEAIQAAEAGALDLALVCVLESRGSNDIQVAEVLSGRFRLPVVLLSNHSGMAALDRVSKSGTMGVVVKPFLLEQLGSAIELTIARHRMERRLEHQRNWFHSVLSGLVEGVIVTDATGCVSFANRAAAEVLGMEARDLLERPLSEVLAPAPGQNGGAPDPASALIPPGETFRERRLAILVGGQVRLLEASSRSVEESEPGQGGAVITLRDITERERQAEAVRLAAKMQSAASLASGIAHHFNNLLQIVLGHAELVVLDTPAGGKANRSGREILRAAESFAGLVTQLKRFSSEERSARDIVAVSDLFGELIALVHAMVPSNITVVLPTVLIDACVLIHRQDIMSALLHLVDNAHDAMKQGGTLTLGLARRVPTAPGALPMIELSVCDTGPGLSPDVRSRIFEPFVSTKTAGAGLGLASVLRTAQLNDGTVEIDNRPGEGTTFRVLIPEGVSSPHLADEPADELSPDVRALRGTESILVVEDEETICFFLERVLSELGYAVRAVGRPSEALAVLEGGTEPFHLMITDLMMPEMLGSELALRAEKARPGIRVILMSAYAGEEARALVGTSGLGRPRLEKPFRMDDLARLVRDELDRSPAASGPRD